jgi:hypothetical protein
METKPPDTRYNIVGDLLFTPIKGRTRPLFSRQAELLDIMIKNDLIKIDEKDYFNRLLYKVTRRLTPKAKFRKIDETLEKAIIGAIEIKCRQLKTGPAFRKNVVAEFSQRVMKRQQTHNAELLAKLNVARQARTVFPEITGQTEASPIYSESELKIMFEESCISLNGVRRAIKERPEFRNALQQVLMEPI